MLKKTRGADMVQIGHKNMENSDGLDKEESIFVLKLDASTSFGRSGQGFFRLLISWFLP
jgi:hypothetical protein